MFQNVLKFPLKSQLVDAVNADMSCSLVCFLFRAKGFYFYGLHISLQKYVFIYFSLSLCDNELVKYILQLNMRKAVDIKR
jgi:hypothetical protein